MKTVLTILAFTAVAWSSSCTKKVDTLEDTPRCIRKEIARWEASEPDESLSVWRYRYNGQTVYFFPAAGCCDKASILVDEDCNVVCNPDGGFSGNGDGNCPDFFTSRTDEVLVWENGR